VAISPEQCRAARKLLGWSRSALSVRSGIGPQVVWEFESGRRAISSRQQGKLRQAVEEAGVEFLNHDRSCVRRSPEHQPRDERSE
jgi:transcriptional regulator with XRE-family HTH domain